ncbi:MAG: Maf family protein [Anaerolineales bacterium]|nr:Maf family protein [Anaerolineales bacterium]
MSPDKIVPTLASGSPRRRRLLSLAGWLFHVQPADVDETPRAGEAPLEYVLRMAETKARAAAESHRPNALILAADTTVADGDAILGKPGDPAEAIAVLQRLRGRAHQVHTAIAVIRAGALHSDVCTTTVPMRAYSDEEIFQYVKSGDPFDKAGGYAIQHDGFQPVASMQGCYANVMGLPLCHLVRTLRKLGIDAPNDVPQACQEHLEYQCPVFEQILQGQL